MRSVCRVLFVLVAVVCVPALAWAQASITGVVRDASGAVLPGVTVEVASPVLIEKVRTAVTDGSGQYRIIDLRPGTYTRHRSRCTGFNTVRRDGIELTGTFVATVDAEHARRHARRDDYRHRRVADRRRAEHPAADDGERRRDRVAADVALVRRALSARAGGHRRLARRASCGPAWSSSAAPAAAATRAACRLTVSPWARRSAAAASRATCPTSRTRRRSASPPPAASAKPRSAARR